MRFFSTKDRPENEGVEAEIEREAATVSDVRSRGILKKER